MTKVVPSLGRSFTVSEAVRRAFNNAEGPLTTNAACQKVAELQGVQLDEELTGAVVTLLFHLHAKGQITAQATYTQTLWWKVEQPNKHTCFGCEDKHHGRQPCESCIADCMACWQIVWRGEDCSHNGVFAHDKLPYAWCGHCQAFIPREML